jgi:hypothetical protein
METYLRMMFLKFRYRLGYDSLCREVADSITWRRFCRIPLKRQYGWDHTSLDTKGARIWAGHGIPGPQPGQNRSPGRLTRPSTKIKTTRCGQRLGLYRQAQLFRSK